MLTFIRHLNTAEVDRNAIIFAGIWWEKLKLWSDDGAGKRSGHHQMNTVNTVQTRIWTCIRML